MTMAMVQLLASLCGTVGRPDICMETVLLQDPKTATRMAVLFRKFQDCDERSRYPYPESIRKCMSGGTK